MSKSQVGAIKPTYTRKVSFAHCFSAEDRQNHANQILTDNAVFLNSVLALLTDEDKPFLYEDDKKLYQNYIKNTRFDLKDRVQTLKFVRDNRHEWFKDGSIIEKKQNVISIFEYLLDNEVLMQQTPSKLNQDIDVNLAVQTALHTENFSLKDPQNPIRKAWDLLAKKTNDALTAETSYSK